MHFSKLTLCILLSFNLLLTNGFSHPTKRLVARHLLEQLRNDTEVLRAAEKNIVEAIQNGTHVTEQKLAQGLRNSTNLTSMAEVGKQFTTELVGTGLTIAGLAAVGIVAPEIVIPASVAGGIALEKASTAATEHAKQDGNSSKAENVSSQAGNSNDDRGEPNSLQ